MKRFFTLFVAVAMIAGTAMAQHHHDGRGHGHNRGHGRTEYYCASAEQMHMVMRVLDSKWPNCASYWVSSVWTIWHGWQRNSPSMTTDSSSCR